MSTNAKRHRRPLTFSRVMTYVLLIIAFPVGIASFISGHAVLLTVFFLSHEIGRGAFRPVSWSLSNDRFDKDERRSLFNSIQASFTYGGAAIGLVILAKLTLWFSSLEIWRIASGAILLLAIFSWRKNCH